MLDAYEPITDDSSQSERTSYWKAGIGLQQVDGLEVSDNLLELAGANIQGLIGYDAVEQAIIDDYQKRDLSIAGILGGFEADLVAARIARLLSSNDFILSVATLKSIHGVLFRGLDLFDHNLTPGVFKTQNWRKSEHILYGQSVHYGDAGSVHDNLLEAVERESGKRYCTPLDNRGLQDLAGFCSRIWEIHPFSEGNTRTVAVYIEKYLRSMGFSVDNSSFEHYSVYFRNALVRSCYIDVAKNIPREPVYLERFFENLLLGTSHPLTNKDLYVEALDPERENGCGRQL